MQQTIQCWCGNTSHTDFSADYLRCHQCNTLISKTSLEPNQTVVKNDEEDFYGKKYWLSYQCDEHGYPDILKRTRTDLSERCIHWLRTALKYKLPPAKSLELGCAHGGFIALLRQVGYDASGLEMSPTIAELAKDTFDVPMLVGPLEQQQLLPSSLDMIVLMDVLEHFPDPTQTIKRCFNLLKQDGILIIQTPRFPDMTHAEMLEKQDPFLEQLKAGEHLYLLSQQSVEKFFREISPEPVHIQFEPAIFDHYDMYFVVSREPLHANTDEKIDDYLSTNIHTRLIQALLDTANQRDEYIKLYQQADVDRIGRLRQIEQFQQQFSNRVKQKLRNLWKKLRNQPL